MEVGSVEARELILYRLLAENATKRTIVDELVSDFGWERDAAWAAVRAVDEMLAKERADPDADARGASVIQQPLLDTLMEGIGKIILP